MKETREDQTSVSKNSGRRSKKRFSSLKAFRSTVAKSEGSRIRDETHKSIVFKNQQARRSKCTSPNEDRSKRFVEYINSDDKNDICTLSSTPTSSVTHKVSEYQSLDIRTSKQNISEEKPLTVNDTKMDKNIDPKRDFLDNPTSFGSLFQRSLDETFMRMELLLGNGISAVRSTKSSVSTFDCTRDILPPHQQEENCTGNYVSSRISQTKSKKEIHVPSGTKFSLENPGVNNSSKIEDVARNEQEREGFINLDLFSSKIHYLSSHLLCPLEFTGEKENCRKSKASSTQTVVTADKAQNETREEAATDDVYEEIHRNYSGLYNDEGYKVLYDDQGQVVLLHDGSDSTEVTDNVKKINSFSEEEINNLQEDLEQFLSQGTSKNKWRENSELGEYYFSAPESFKPRHEIRNLYEI